MDSLQSVVSPLKNTSVFPEPEKHKSNHSVENPSGLSRKNTFQRKEAATSNLGEFLGVLEVHIHEARGIQNICIYQNQDVYAKLCLTNDPGNTVLTQIINGGGRNPVFDENLRFDVRKADSSLKCEIWMLSRVRNYLEDQLLGFTLVSLSEILLNDGKLEKDFSLTSSDLFHSPAGIVRLSLSYVGESPDAIPIPALPTPAATDVAVVDIESPESLPCELDKIEFPDPMVVNENHQMVTQYFENSCTKVDTKISDSPVNLDTENQDNSDAGVELIKSVATGTISSMSIPKRAQRINKWNCICFTSSELRVF